MFTFSIAHQYTLSFCSDKHVECIPFLINRTKPIFSILNPTLFPSMYTCYQFSTSLSSLVKCCISWLCYHLPPVDQLNSEKPMAAKCHLCTLQMFYEDGNTLDTFVRPQAYTKV